MRAIHAIATLLVALLLVAPTQGQAPADADFLRRAHEIDVSGIASGQLALQQAQTAEARQLAEQLINVHSANNARLQQLAAQLGVALPQTGGTVDLGGQALNFDQAFFSALARDHGAAVALYEQQGTLGQDWRVRDFARQAQLALQEIHTRALDLSARG